jgi:hypothetical protein
VQVLAKDVQLASLMTERAKLALLEAVQFAEQATVAFLGPVGQVRNEVFDARRTFWGDGKCKRECSKRCESLAQNWHRKRLTQSLEDSVGHAT